jgi:DnaJ-domain-containing protein 1
MPPANEYGQYFVRWFDGLGLVIQSIVLFGVFMLLRGLLLWMKSRRQRREAEAERARLQKEQWTREQQQRQQQESQEQKEKQRTHERTQKRRRKRYARDRDDADSWGRHDQRGEHREGDQDGGAQPQTNEEPPRPWWHVLGIPEGSTLDDVKAAYYAKVKQYHPDKVMGLGEEFHKLADDKTKEINEAFERAKRALQ